MTNGEASATISFEPAFVPEDQIIIPLKKVSEKPVTTSPTPTTATDKNPVVLNIETTGLRPWEHRIIAIGLQDPKDVNAEPTIIIDDDEAVILNSLFTIIKDFGFNQMIGYGLSFDLRFIVIRAMNYGITCKEFADMELYDLMQGMAQIKFEFVYSAQKPPSLSEISDFFWRYPKSITDMEMIKLWLSGEREAVKEFASSQITRIILLYYLFEYIIKTSYFPTTSGIRSNVSGSLTNPVSGQDSKLTIPEANKPETWTAKCPNDLSEHEVSVSQTSFKCPIDGTIIQR